MPYNIRKCTKICNSVPKKMICYQINSFPPYHCISRRIATADELFLSVFEHFVGLTKGLKPKDCLLFKDFIKTFRYFFKFCLEDSLVS